MDSLFREVARQRHDTEHIFPSQLSERHLEPHSSKALRLGSLSLAHSPGASQSLNAGVSYTKHAVEGRSDMIWSSRIFRGMLLFF